MAEAPEALGIRNFRRLSPTLTTSGQPSEAQLAGLAAAGITTVINLALPDSPGALADEAAALAALGLRYVHIPVDFQAPTEGDFRRFCDAIEEAGGEMLHVHCVANYRVSAFLHRYRRERLGWSAIDADRDLLALWQPDGTWRAFIDSAAQP